MMFELSPELKLKLIDEKNFKISIHQEFSEHLGFAGQMIKVPTIRWIEIILDLKDEPKLYEECIEWMKMFATYFKTSFTAAKLSIGPFEGLWPTQCDDESMVVNFLSDDYIPGRENWKDWFVQGEQHAS